MNQINDGLFFGHDLLDPIERALSRRLIHRPVLQLHELVDLGFPGGSRLGFAGIPRMMRTRTHPHIHLTIGVDVQVSQAEQTSLIVLLPGVSLEFRHYPNGQEIHADANLSQILLYYGPDLGARLRTGIRNQRPFHRISLPVPETVPIQPKAILLQQLEGDLRIEPGRTQSGIEPEFVGGRDRARRAMRITAISEADHIAPVDSGGHSPPEQARLEPAFLVSGELRIRALVEPEELGIE